MKLREILAVVSLAASPGMAQTSVQVQTLENVAMAVAVTQSCATAQVDPGVLAATLLLRGLRVADVTQGGRYMPLLLARAAEADRVFREQGASVACGVGKSMFGPRGVNVPGLLTER